MATTSLQFPDRTRVARRLSLAIQSRHHLPMSHGGWEAFTLPPWNSQNEQGAKNLRSRQSSASSNARPALEFPSLSTTIAASPLISTVLSVSRLGTRAATRSPMKWSALSKLTVRQSPDRRFNGVQQEPESVRNREDVKARAVIVSTWQMVSGQNAPAIHIIDILCGQFQLDKLRWQADAAVTTASSSTNPRRLPRVFFFYVGHDLLQQSK